MLEQCPVCLRNSARFAFEKNGYKLSRCECCDFIFTHPYPSEEQITSYYNNYRSCTEDFYPKAASRMYRSYVKSMRFIPNLIGKSAIDIGCGGGMMVKAFSMWGAKASGLDISERSILYAKKHYKKCDFYCETFSKFRERGLKYDFVFSTEVIEHLAGSDEFMKTLADITKPGGHVYIATPDAGHEAVPSDISQWDNVYPPEHLQFFNRKNIEILFGRYGFTLKHAFRKRVPAHSLMFIRQPD